MSEYFLQSSIHWFTLCIHVWDYGILCVVIDTFLKSQSQYIEKQLPKENGEETDDWGRRVSAALLDDLDPMPSTHIVAHSYH